VPALVSVAVCLSQPFGLVRARACVRVLLLLLLLAGTTTWA